MDSMKSPPNSSDLNFIEMNQEMKMMFLKYIFELQKILTPDKCKKCINNLKKIKDLSFFTILYFIYLNLLTCES
ncbi:hypothetical protein BpHYR1_039419 [Brachionus plicatilis]|uniref:Uncharacterized protein n=1 Tax=Brachionus plicatilis TaxID=10195 RepID=A0A3M7QZV2_BRAPC|nr:hypothetical protein BpHYR1_039419 [Brachionus plicatilis]